MKKLLAVILSVICVFSCFALPCSAASDSGVLGELADSFFEKIFGTGIEEDTPLGYGVIYNIDSLDGVSVVYKPTPSISFSNPGTYTITSDTPLSIDYEFICWRDSKGNRYYAGDKIYVDGTITLYAVWGEKQDNDVRVARVIKTTMEAFRRLVGKFLGFYKVVVEFNENYVPTPSDAPRYYDLILNSMYYVDDNYAETKGDERVLFYIDSYLINEQNKFKRIDTFDPETDYENYSKVVKEGATVYLCTGWDKVYERPVNLSETYTLSYRFADLLGPDREDVLVIDTVLEDGKDVVSDYISGTLEGKDDVKNIYMIVTVTDSLYSNLRPNGLEYDEFCNPVSCVFTLKK